ncbi:MAG: DNA polymerase III subunit gamma/tau [Bifidobacterium sp.]|jgi:DNA polymerase-3 subunit gamma/tau|nr:DNA polymerase III subunit gamma/tau [Bifidobacterium sp.]
MALALYRRYRPDTFAGVIGQDQVTVPLSHALDEGKLTHAYLFSGPRGCGKTSSARILARCINCEHGPTSHPCGECESCRDLATGGPGSIDVVEIDAASHNGVEDARELRERATFAPARDRYKIFILDEAHMVTQQGFNALLKIVEEPPEHVMFIFATTEPDKVIGTIRSRTHHYPFRLVPTEVMGPYLQGICRQEHIETEPGVLKLAMRAGGGSVRDTLSVLDQLMVGAVDGLITHDAAISLLGFTPDALIGEAIDAVIGRDGGKLYGIVQKVVVGGFDPRRFVEDLLSRVRDLLVLTLGGERAERVLGDDCAAEDMDRLHQQAAALGLTVLSTMAETINAALAAMTGAVSPRMRLELLAARLLAGRDPQTTLIVGSTNAQADADGIAPASASGAAGRADYRANQSGNARRASRSGGFAGSHRTALPQQTNADSRVTNDPAPSENVQDPAPASDVSSAVPPVAPTPTRSTAEANSMDTRSVDERWDAVVAALPADVREYVTRDKVVRVSLASNASGRQRLAMTFDRPLSQHAFALAVSSDQEHQGHKAANVVLAGTRAVFGENTMIAPAAIAANGERVESSKHMKPQQLAQIKRQIAMEKAGLAATGLAAHVAPRASSRPKEGETPAAGGPHSADEPVHRQVSHDQEDIAGREQEPPRLDDDPWLDPTPAVREQHAVADASAGVTGNDLAAPAQSHHKHVAVPDMSNDEDPWSTPTEPLSEPMSDNEIESIAPPDRAGGFAGHNGVQDQNEDSWAVRSRDPDDAMAGVQPDARSDADAAAVSSAPGTRRVDSDDDEYSLNDKSLSAATAMDLDELEKLFEVKGVEEFAADDPHNPRNIQPPSKARKQEN